ncbi:MAG: hypothetical protein ACTSVC_10830 [Promethearchaeota archaeon]
MKEKLKRLLNNMKNWEKTPTTVKGVKIIKIPENKYIPQRLAIEITPVDEEGKPLKKRGTIIISNEDLFLKYREIFNNEKVHDLIKAIDEIRSETPKKYKNIESKETFDL